MPKLLIAFPLATGLLASSGIWKANAATIASAGTLAAETKSYGSLKRLPTATDTPAEPIAMVLRQRLSALLRLWLPTPILWLRLQAIWLLRLRLATRHHHRYRTRLGLALLRTTPANSDQWMQGFFRSSKRGER